MKQRVCESEAKLRIPPALEDVSCLAVHPKKPDDPLGRKLQI